ncbi:hypothetical protein GBK04_21845 [Cytophagaceae bacterium SJW1-29]|uniref:histidine kinase n=2 Tax=Salmonirosea aquatica TaxID=2654236 RepID=A0A7C9BTZ7_9BACT|nr:hypothetical protein [Cytophagaceae bacterium SJW1-29]
MNSSPHRGHTRPDAPGVSEPHWQCPEIFAERYPPLVTIRGGYIAEGDLSAPWTTEGAYIRICIADRGIGFDEMYLGKIFAIFQRLHTQNEYEGTGIGLAIVKKIVEKHNGLISANSKPNEGTTFNIILPVRQSKTFVPDETPA